MSNATIKKALLIGIILITLLEIYFSYTIYSAYRNVYRSGIFIPLYLQPILYSKVLNNDVSRKRLRLVTLGLISILLPMMIFFTLPAYTFSEGKHLVEEQISQSETVLFKDLGFDRSTIPATQMPRNFLLSDQVYYYETLEDYFVVIPMTGEVISLEQSFFRNMTDTP